MRRSLLYFFVFIVIIVFLVVRGTRYSRITSGRINSHSPDVTANPENSINSTECNADRLSALWKHVYKPDRFIIIRNCITVTGYITKKKKESDGDLHILLRPDTPFDTLLNEKNRIVNDSCLVVEIICAEKNKEPIPAEACSGCRQQVYVPYKDQHVSITGSYVLDGRHGWAEIHPVLEIHPIQ